jgi:hypothetical protein
MSKFNKIFDKFIYYFLLASPIINIFTNSLIKNENYPLSISFILFFIKLLVKILIIGLNNKNI